MKQYLFLGDSITDADHLFDPANLGYGYVSLLARRPEYVDARFVNRGHEGFTIERVLQMLRRDGIGGHWDAITTDGIHLTPHGNTLLADLWHQAFTALFHD